MSYPNKANALFKDVVITTKETRFATVCFYCAPSFPVDIPRSFLVTTIGILLCGPVVAADAIPDAGRVIQDQRQPAHTMQPDNADDQILDISATPETNTQPQEESLRVRIDSITIQGNFLFATSELRQTFRDALGTELSLSDMRLLAAKITAFYREQGYVFARAYLPPQEINNHNLTIVIIEGQFGKVRIHNTSDLPDVIVSGVWPGEAIKLAELERSLLLLSDTPGIDAKSTLKPGEKVGTADLYIDIVNGKRYDGVFSIDNYGSHSTGENRINSAFYLYSPLAQGDQLNLRATTTDEALYFGGIDYQIPINADGLKFGISYERVEYTLGSDFESLDAHGTADIAGIDLQYPFIRSRLLNLHGKVSGSMQSLQDHIDLLDESTEKNTVGLGVSLYGNSRDLLFGGGSNYFSMSLNYGDLEIESGSADILDELTAETQGSYAVVDVNLQRFQYLTENFRLHFLLSGQLASKNLTSAEKFSLGGPFAVRAYPQGEATGDEGAVATIEIHYALTDQLDVNFFADGGYVTINKDPWTSDSNHRDLSGYGIGVDWATKFGLSLKTTIAWKAGNETPTADVDRIPRIWAQLMYRL